MACLHCTTRVLRVFLPDSIVSLRASRTLPSATGRRPGLLRTLPQRRAFHNVRRTSTATALRPLTDDDHIPFVPAADEFLPSAVRERLKGATMDAVNPIGPPPPPPQQVNMSLDDWDVGALLGIPDAKIVKKVKPVKVEEKKKNVEEDAVAEATEAEVESTRLGESMVAEETTASTTTTVLESSETEVQTSAKAEDVATEVQKEKPVSAGREKFMAALKARKEAQAASWKAELAEAENEKEESKAFKETPVAKVAKKKINREPSPSIEDAVSRATRKEAATKAAAETPVEDSKAKAESPLSRGPWKLPEVEEYVPERLKRLEARIASTPRKELEPWMIEKAATIRKLGGERWDPKKKLSPEALEGIRALHAQDPERFSTPRLARLFEVSPEAIRRILKSKWKPKPEEAVKRELRWLNRGHRIFEAKVETGEIIPKSKKNREKKERYEKEKMRKALEQPLSGGIGDRIL